MTRFGDALDPLLAQGLVPPADAPFKLIVSANGRIEVVALGNPDQCLAGTRPYGANPKKEQALVQSFLDANNRHNLPGVLGTLADGMQPSRVSYTDCNYAQGTATALSGKTAIETWLRARFADGDRLEEMRMVFDSYLSEPPNNPLTVLVYAMRSSGALEARGIATEAVTLRIVPLDVTRIQLWQVWSSCEARTP